MPDGMIPTSIQVVSKRRVTRCQVICARQMSLTCFKTGLTWRSPPTSAGTAFATPPPWRSHSDITAATEARPTAPQLFFSVDEVRTELRWLHSSKVARPDDVCPRPLKKGAAQLVEPLLTLFNLSLKSGRTPDLFKKKHHVLCWYPWWDNRLRLMTKDRWPRHHT